MNARTMRERAALCRRMLGGLWDERDQRALQELAEHYEAEAEALENGAAPKASPQRLTDGPQAAPEPT